MSLKVRDAAEALRGTLRLAAADGFGQVEAEDVPRRLSKGVAKVLGALRAKHPLREEFERLEQAVAPEAMARQGREDRMGTVALAMRLCTALEVEVAADVPKARLALVEQGAQGTTPLDTLPGVGRVTVEKLQALGIAYVEDLVRLMPLDYEDRRERKALEEVREGDVAVVEGTVRKFYQGYARGRFLATLDLTVDGEERETVLQARWFHRVGGLGQRLKEGSAVCVVGVLKRFRGRPSMIHPEVREAGDPGPAIVLRYPSAPKLAGRTLAKLVAAAAARTAEHPPPETIPADILSAVELPTMGASLRAIHLPEPDIDATELAALRRGEHRAHVRMAFEEFFFVQLALLRRRQEEQAAGVGTARAVGEDPLGAVEACVPFALTGAQRRVVAEIEQDLRRPVPMMRLLQGDVGSGKTVVAFAAALALARAGGQTAILAPTEILAAQHLRTFEPWCQTAGLRVALLTGAMPSGPRRTLLAMLAEGKIDILVGTHALLTTDVYFSDLALCVVDEQHRFGVEQRSRLRDKGAAPHLLVMTATPIPRTMALLTYGELEVSVLDELPPGREPAVTQLVVGPDGLAQGRDKLRRSVAKGVQAFVVCPLVEASEAVSATDVEQTATALRELMPGVEVGVVHGRMANEDKDAVMGRFREGEVRVLVATTVIEVGVDVPNARMILVEHAERFGLAQLHQLRGRVGRASGASLCVLHSGMDEDSDAVARLKVLSETHDGFVIAERDLELRGPGEVFGTRQAGLPTVRYLGMGGAGTRLLATAREHAARLLKSDPELKGHPNCAEELRRRDASVALHAGESG